VSVSIGGALAGKEATLRCDGSSNATKRTQLCNEAHAAPHLWLDSLRQEMEQHGVSVGGMHPAMVTTLIISKIKPTCRRRRG
jgi:hypothetical protein